jgi:hypothetical protein
MFPPEKGPFSALQLVPALSTFLLALVFRTFRLAGVN